MITAATKKPPLRSTIIPVERFEGLEKLDGLIALIVFGLLFAWTYFAFSIIKITPLYDWMPWGGRDHTLQSLAANALVAGPGFLLIFLVLKIRRQKWSSVGLNRTGLKLSLLAGALLLVVYLVLFISRRGLLPGLVFDILYFTLWIGFFEELVFRGFIWPRLVVLSGKIWGALLSGVFFGVIHAPFNIVFLEAGFWSEILNNIGGGIIGGLLFLFVYSLSWNILLPTFVHSFLDLLGRL